MKNQSNNLLNPELIAERGEQIYQERLKDSLEKKHTGEFVAIEVESRKHFLAKTAENVLEQAPTAFPDKIFYIIRVANSVEFQVKLLDKHKEHSWRF